MQGHRPIVLVNNWGLWEADFIVSRGWGDHRKWLACLILWAGGELKLATLG